MGFFSSSPMIVREGHKISRTYTLYLYCRASPQGNDKMSNRSSGTSYIDDQRNRVGNKRERAKEEEKKRQIGREISVYVYLDLSNERNVLIG
jgi:hypothetical protein